MRRGVLIVCLALVLLGSFVFSSAEYAPGEILVKYNDSIIRTASARDIKVLDINDYYIHLKVDDNMNIEELVRELESYEDVVYAQPNYIYRTFSYPNDPLNSSQWALDNVDMFSAWDITKGIEDIVIAIIDTGADLNHEDLVNKLWNNSEGYHGYDFVNNNNDPSDDHDDSHGTHCAGIAAAETNNSLGIAGICPNCKLMIVKALNNEGTSSSNIIANAIDYAKDNNATIISMSFGGNSSEDVLSDAINLAYNEGIILIAAAGNDGDTTENYPAAYDNVISVGATNSSNQRASYSQYGSWVNFFAPGSSIWSTTIGSGSYGSMSGTSMATPLVAGAIGLMKSLDFSLNQSEIIKILNDSADEIETDVGNVSKINVFSALSLVDYVSVNLISPEDENITNVNETNFSCSANSSISILTNLTFFLFNDTDLVYNISEEISGIDNSSLFNYTFENEFDYYWSCQACNNNSICKLSENYTITYDLTMVSPEITNKTLFFEVYLNFSFNERANYSLNYSVVGNEIIENVNSSDFIENHSIEISELEGDTEYEFNLSFCDRAGNCNSTEFNLTTLSIFVNLTSPEEERYTNTNETEFYCEINSTESYNLTNVTFLLYNSTGDLIDSSNLTLEGYYNVSSFNYTFENESNYSWTCLAYNNKSESYSPVNYTLFYDITAPFVEVSSSTTENSAQVTFSNLQEEEMNYSITGDIERNSSDYNLSYNLSFSGLNCETSYNYELVCCDRAGNCNETSETFTTADCPSSPSSGGGSSSFPSAPSYLETVLGTSSSPFTLTSLGSTHEEELDVGQKVYFKLSVDKSHSITLSQVINQVAVLVIQSEPIYIYLAENSSKKLSLDNSNYYDVEISVGSISDTSAEIKIKRIENSINQNFIEPSEKIGSQEEEALSEKKEDASSRWYYWVVGVIVFLGIAYLIWISHGNNLRKQELLLNVLHMKNHEEMIKPNKNK